MSDHDARTPSQKPFERLLDHRFRAGVYVARSLVQDENARIGEHGAGEGEQLALTLAQGTAALAKNRVVPVRQLRDEVMGLGGAGGSLDLLARCRLLVARPAVADVLRDRAGEQERFLQYRGDVRAQAPPRDLAHVAPIHPYRSARDVVEAR